MGDMASTRWGPKLIIVLPLTCISICPPPLQVPTDDFLSSYAWSFIYDAQPHHVTAPFKGELLPPIGVPGVCHSSQFKSTMFVHQPFVEGAWVARLSTNANVWMMYGDRECSPGFSGISVATTPTAELRLHFEGCGGLRVAFVLPLTNESVASTVHDVPLVDFICQVSPKLCDQARATELQESRADDLTTATTTQRMPGSASVSQTDMGMGTCAGAGVIPGGIVRVTEEAKCAEKCARRIRESIISPEASSCTGYSWSNQKLGCVLYTGFPIESS